MITRLMIENPKLWRVTRRRPDLQELYDACDALNDQALGGARKAWLLAAREGKLDEAQAIVEHKTDGLSLSVMAAVLIDHANNFVKGADKKTAYRAVTELPEDVDNPCSPNGIEGQAYLDSYRGAAFTEIGDRVNAVRFLYSANRGFRSLGIVNVSTAVAIDKLEADPRMRVEKLKLRLIEIKQSECTDLVAYIADDLASLGSELLDYALINEALRDMAPGFRKQAITSAINYVSSGSRDAPLSPLEDGPAGLMTSVHVLRRLDQALAAQAAFYDNEAETIAQEIINYVPALEVKNQVPIQLIAVAQARAAVILGRFDIAEEIMLTIPDSNLPRVPFYVECLRIEISLRSDKQVEKADLAALIRNLEKQDALPGVAGMIARVMPDALVQIEGMHPVLRRAASRISSSENWPEMIRRKARNAEIGLKNWREFVSTHPERSFAQSWLSADGGVR